MIMGCHKNTVFFMCHCISTWLLQLNIFSSLAHKCNRQLELPLRLSISQAFYCTWLGPFWAKEHSRKLNVCLSLSPSLSLSLDGLQLVRHNVSLRCNNVSPSI